MGKATPQKHNTHRKRTQTIKLIWLVTDGGLNTDNGYFGWVIATDKTIIWKGYEYIQGDAKQMELLRTESVSTLDVLCFPYRYCQFHGISIQEENTKHYADNLTLMRRMQWAPK
eukprot:4890706-Ditylum_brightwellii.AAC.1